MASFMPNNHNKGTKSLPTPSMSPNDLLDRKFRTEQPQGQWHRQIIPPHTDGVMQRAVIDSLGNGLLGNCGIVMFKGVDHEPGVIVVTDGKRKIKRWV